MRVKNPVCGLPVVRVIPKPGRGVVGLIGERDRGRRRRSRGIGPEIDLGAGRFRRVGMSGGQRPGHGTDKWEKRYAARNFFQIKGFNRLYVDGSGYSIDVEFQGGRPACLPAAV